MRVSASGNLILPDWEDIKARVRAINLSAGVLCITAHEYPIDQKMYQIQVLTPADGKILFSGVPVYQPLESVGIKITSLKRDQLKIIYQIVGSFQLTDDFIKYIDERDIIHNWLVDESGENLAIKFEIEGEKNR